MDDPQKNDEGWLRQRALELNELSDEELRKMASSAKEKKNEFESGVEEEMKKKFYVK